MAHEGDDSGADPKFVGGDGLEDAPSLKLGTVSPQLPPPQSGSETVGGTDQQQRPKRKNRGIRETGQPAENKGMSKDALYRANRKVAQQKVEEEKNDLKAKNEELEGENMQLKWEKFGLEKQVLELKAVAEKEKAVAEKEKAVAEKEKAVAEKEKAEKRYIQRELEITTQKLQTQTEELNSLKREHEITAQNLQTQTEELNSLKKSYDWLTTGSLSQRTSVSPPKLAQVWATWSKRMVTFLINTSTKLPSLPVDSQTTDGPDSPPASGGREMGTESVPGVGGTLTECLGASSSPPLASGDESRAAVRIQQVYRSYRTRRRLADSAVVAEKLCWRARDFARLNRSTISFFNFLKPETATSGCNRITLNASKVGKRLCRDAKAQQLAFRHWIEAIDARHRYGHNLQTYFLEWYKNDAGQPFFYWLDVGAGKELDLKKCPRSKLRQQRIKYLGPREREHYEYIVAEGQIKHKQTEELLDTINVSKEGKWIFIMSTSKRLYAAEKKKGLFHHSSFLAGGATLAAGRLEAEKGILRSISAYGGHYKPGGLDNFLSFLKEKGVNINEVKICKLTDDSNSYCDGKSNGLGVSSEVLTNSDLHEPEMPTEEKTTPPDSLENDQTETRTTYKRTLSGLKSPRAKVPKTSIMKRINSKEVAKSYQLGHQLSRKWTSGAGPRIGCVANYPLELRQQALEFVNLL